jgi:hypothetical protein
MHSRLAIALSVTLLLTGLYALSGCHTGRVMNLRQGQAVQTPADDAPLSDASTARVQGEWSRAMSEMDRTSLATHWSLMRIERHPKAKSKAHPRPPEWFKAVSLMPDGQTAQIICWRGQGHDVLVVTVRAGLFGDKAAEARFIRNLARNLAKPPVPDRSITFDMPSLEDYQNAPHPAQ